MYGDPAIVIETLNRVNDIFSYLFISMQAIDEDDIKFGFVLPEKLIGSFTLGTA
jgi:hypothetical protein